MNNKISFNYLIIVFVCVLSLGVLFVLVNYGMINTKSIDDSLDKVTESVTLITTTSDNSKKDSIIVNGVVNEFKVETMHSYLGFSINYDKDNISYDILSNSSVIFNDINNSKNYLKLIKLSESDYNSKYELYKNNELHENEIEGNSYNYSFYRIGGNCFEIIESIDNNDEFGEYLKVLFKYMISSLKEH